MKTVTVLGASGFAGSAVHRLGEVFRLVAREVAGHTGRGPVDVPCVAPPSHAPETDFRSVTVGSTPFRSITGRRPEMSRPEGVRRTVAALPSSDQGKVRT
ncbi:hypothetical protein [Amycolatopsis balhimycina]|uniref:Putative 4-ketoreductase n=1 Tax=Amycolatopsis balhimycina TaxID=208443 RepID=Q939X6_AMYBA|nr:hypothetical protein [Amycolatopsis balhimycina]CAC48375.1 putative 4-ketoreductase [Amycolatopsis balhimycina DSM 5908]